MVVPSESRGRSRGSPRYRLAWPPSHDGRSRWVPVSTAHGFGAKGGLVSARMDELSRNDQAGLLTSVEAQSWNSFRSSARWLLASGKKEIITKTISPKYPPRTPLH